MKFRSISKAKCIIFSPFFPALNINIILKISRSTGQSFPVVVLFVPVNHLHPLWEEGIGFSLSKGQITKLTMLNLISSNGCLGGRETVKLNH